MSPTHASASPPATEKSTLPIACRESPSRIKATVSTEKVENVVKPPRRPMNKAVRMTTSTRSPINPTSRPSTNDPLRFTASVAAGKAISPSHRIMA